MNGYYLITENGTDISLGRLSFWVLLIISVVFWFWKPIADFPPTLLQTLMATMIYNFGKKGVELFGTYLDTKGKV